MGRPREDDPRLARTEGALILDRYAPVHGRPTGIEPSVSSPLFARGPSLAELDERARDIFRRIVESYLETGEPEEGASGSSFLASDDASYITGQRIYPDGGRLALNYTAPVPD